MNPLSLLFLANALFMGAEGPLPGGPPRRSRRPSPRPEPEPELAPADAERIRKAEEKRARRAAKCIERVNRAKETP